MEPLSAIGARVRTLRKRRGLTQAELAGRIGRSVEALSVLERGRSTPTLPVLGRLSEELAVPLRDFFAPAGPPQGTGPQTPEAAARQAARMSGLLDCARDLPPPELTLAAEILERIAAYAARRPSPAAVPASGPSPETAPESESNSETDSQADTKSGPGSGTKSDGPREMLAMLLRLYKNDRQALTASLTRRRRFLAEMGDADDAAFLDRLLKLLWER